MSTSFDNITDSILRVNTIFALLALFGFNLNLVLDCNPTGGDTTNLLYFYVNAFTSFISSTSIASAVNNCRHIGISTRVIQLGMLVSICTSVSGTAFFMLAMRNLILIKLDCGTLSIASMLVPPSLALLLLYLSMLVFALITP